MEVAGSLNSTRKAGEYWRVLWYLIVPPKGHRILPTLPGNFLILVSLGMGLAAYNSSNNILFMALSLMLSTLILSGLLSWLNFRKLRWRLLLPPHFRVNEPAVVQIELRNGKVWLPTYSLWFKTALGDSKETQPIYLRRRLNPEAAIKLDWNFTPRSRGSQPISVSGMESQFPFGFLKKMVGTRIQKDIIIFPERIDYLFNSSRGVHSHFMGADSSRMGSSGDMLSVRGYQNGDDQRRVHWKASAR